MTTVITDRRNLDRFRETVDEATKKLVATQHRADASYVQTPLLYPSGANVVVRVDGGPKKFFVSDYGMGSDEAEMMGAANLFARHARTVAEQSGVKFDSHSFFIIEVTPERLSGAITTIANCSYEAVAITALKHSERAASDANERLYTRLVTVFRKDFVVKNAEIIGASNTTYHVGNLVEIGQHKAIFDAVSKHHVSIAHAAMKFQDIARLERPPARIAVVRKKSEFGTYLNVLSQSASVIETGVPDSTIRKLADAA